MKKTLKQRVEYLEKELGHLKYKLNCLETMSTTAKEDCQHDWVEELQDGSTTALQARKMRCRKCLTIQWLYD